MIDGLTFTVSIIGIVFAIIYIGLMSYFSCKQSSVEEKSKKEGQELYLLEKGCSEPLKSTSLSLEGKDKLIIILKDYEISNREIERRENITLLIGSILITASILLLINAIPNVKWVFAAASIFTFTLWLFLIHLMTKKLDDLSYSRVRTMEEALAKMAGYEFGIHRYLLRKTNKTTWIKMRRCFWGFLLILLSIAWLARALFG